jgi:serine phosphatase RsbU (regulator of sigma subunit)
VSDDKLLDQSKSFAEELQNFQEIATAISPSSGEIPELHGIEIGGLLMPLKEVIGGDHIIYIDFNKRYDLDARIEDAEDAGHDDVAHQLRRLKQRGGILVADVSGHRMTDAAIGAMLHQAFLLGVIYELDMSGEITTRLFEHINTRFNKTTRVNKYFTMIYGEISEEGRFRFISAAHPPPMVFSREFGCFVPISQDRLVSFPAVGMFPSSHDPDEERSPSLLGYKKRYEVNEIDLLATGDILLLYTDGLAEHAGGNYFPVEVERLLSGHRNESAESICALLRESLLEAASPQDDISVVAIRKTS